MSNKRVVWTNPDGSTSVLIPAPDVPEDVWMKAVPADAPNPTVVDVAELPQDRMFRGAWTVTAGKCMECPVKSKEIAHQIRREKRAEKFAPHDQLVAYNIPGVTAAAEAERAKIRAADAELQVQLDACKTPAELRQLLTAQ